MSISAGIYVLMCIIALIVFGIGTSIVLAILHTQNKQKQKNKNDKKL